jgi:hypothetical protein
VEHFQAINRALSWLGKDTLIVATLPSQQREQVRGSELQRQQKEEGRSQ